RLSTHRGLAVPDRILIVDDDPEMCALLSSGLSRRAYLTAAHPDAASALSALDAADFDAVITDLNLRGMNGAELCERLAGKRPDIPVVVITAFGSLDTAPTAIRAGAYDFVTKPFEIEQLVLILQRAVRLRRLNEELRRLRSATPEAPAAGLIGESPPMV